MSEPSSLFSFHDAADWLEHFRESANPRTAEERWAYLDQAAVYVEELLAERERLVKLIAQADGYLSWVYYQGEAELDREGVNALISRLRKAWKE